MRQEVGDHEGEVIEGEVGGPAQGTDHGAFLFGGLPGQSVRLGGAVETILGAALAPLTDSLGTDAEALGEKAGALGGAGDLGADGWGCSGVRVNLQHGSFPAWRLSSEAFEAISIIYNGQSNWAPTMSRDL